MRKSVKVVLICLAVFVGVIALAVGAFFIIIEPNVKIFGFATLDMDQLTSYSRTATILDTNGRPIEGTLYDNNKIYVRIDDLPEHTVNAFVAIEDKRFYGHSGIDYKRMASALLSNIKSRSFREGASTITQQLIKNTHLSNEKTLRRKINEMRLARQLERIYSKNQILESYFNILYFGSGLRGIGTASAVMFDKPASELTLAQSAALASIINNPTKYSPYNNIENLTKRKELVLKQMLAQGYISDAQYSDALAENVVFGKDKQNQFVAGLLQDACESLGCTEKELFIKNVTIRTKYDDSVVSAVRAAIKQTELGDDATVRILVLDNESGGIICDETNTAGYINPRRSPASTIKPFLSYAPALENGANPLTQIDDVPTTFDDYSPSNYKGVYRGMQSLKDCLIRSSNIAAVKLLKQNGVENSKSVARAFGLPFDSEDNSLSIALGGLRNGVTLIELANAYRTLANGGKFSEAYYVQSVSDRYRDIFTRKSRYQTAIGDDTAYLITDMLKECSRSGTAKKLKYSGVIAAKTGTNGDEQGNSDCYCIAYTPSVTIAVWFGGMQAKIKNSITGASCCGIINAIVERGAIDTNAEFTMPNSVAYYEVDGNALNDSHEVYLADPMLPKRYRLRSLFSKKHLPVRKSLDIIDFYDRYIWEEFEFCEE